MGFISSLHTKRIENKIDYVIDDELSLFTVSKTDRCHSQMNDVLYERDHKDTLFIKEDEKSTLYFLWREDYHINRII